jgi:hypothetical protein
MKKFKIQISDLLLYNRDDAARSKTIAAELKAMEAKAPEIKAQSEAAKEAYWTAYQELQKSIILNYPLAERKRLQAVLWQAEGAVKGPLKDQADRWHKLSGEAEALTRELREDVYNHVQNYIVAAIAEKKATPSSSDKRWTDKGEWGSSEKVHIISQNFATVDAIVTLLQEFRGLVCSGGRPKLCVNNVVGMQRLSHDEIVEQVRLFEKQVNAIDIFQQVSEEIHPQQFKDLREAKLI